MTDEYLHCKHCRSEEDDPTLSPSCPESIEGKLHTTQCPYGCQTKVEY